MLEAQFKIEPVRTAADLEVTVQLFNEYASSVGVDLSYQDFATELASLPGKYASPTGELLLARDGDGEPVGCVEIGYGGISCQKAFTSATSSQTSELGFISSPGA